MKRSRFSEEQIIGVLREQEAGMKVAEVCRKHGIGHTQAPELHRLRVGDIVRPDDLPCGVERRTRTAS